MSISTAQPVATQVVPGIASLAVLPEVQAALDNQKVATSIDVGAAYLGYYVPGRSYPSGAIVALAGTLFCNRSGAPTSTAPPSGLAWGPVDNKNPVLPANTVLTPAAASGSGTLASPYIVTSGTLPSGSTGLLVTQVSVSGLTPGAYVELADVNAATNGSRYTFTNRLVNGQGVLTFNVVYNDTPASPVATVYTLLLKIGLGSSYVQYVGTVVAGLVDVQQPTIVSPANSSTGINAAGPLSATSFAMTSSADTHLNSDWVIALDLGFTAIMFSSLADAVNKTGITVTPNLSANTIYYAKVRYRSAGGLVSAYSPTISFTTANPAAVVNVPVIATPANGATSVAVTGGSGGSLSVTASAFTLASGVDTHANTDWQIATDAAFSNIVVQSLVDSTNKTTWTPTGLSLSTTYYLRARYRGVGGSLSNWGSASSFTTAAPVGMSWQLVAQTSPVRAGSVCYNQTMDKFFNLCTSTQFSSPSLAVISSSPDGVSWSTPTTLAFNITNIVSIVSLGSKIYIASQTGIQSSSDGITWAVDYAYGADTPTNYLLATAGNRLFLSLTNGATHYVLNSTGNGTWTKTAASTATSDSSINGITSVGYDGTTWMFGLLGSGGSFPNSYFLRTADCVTYTMHDMGVNAETIAYGNGIWVSSPGYLNTAWTTYVNGGYAGAAPVYLDLLGGTFSETSGVVHYSTTGLVNSWKQVNIPIPGVRTIIPFTFKGTNWATTYAAGIFVIPNLVPGGIFTSLDSVTWTYRASSVNYNFAHLSGAERYHRSIDIASSSSRIVASGWNDGVVGGWLVS